MLTNDARWLLFNLNFFYKTTKHTKREHFVEQHSCEIAHARCRENWRRIAGGSCSVLLHQTDCDQAAQSTWLGHSAPVRPNKRRLALFRANLNPPFSPCRLPEGTFLRHRERPECRVPTTFYRPTCSSGFSISFFSPSYCRFVDTFELQPDTRFATHIWNI